MAKRVPYSRQPDDLLYPGRATDFFDPDFGPAPSEAAVCAEMARLAYLRHEDGDGRARLEGFLARAGFQLGPCFNAAGTQGFAAARRGSGDPVTVIAFRGTEPDEPGDLQQDLRFIPTPWAGPGRVHTGFAQALEAVRREVLAAIWGVGGRLLFTGHSLGAAVALLAAALVPPARRGQTMLYTFGCPRVGDEDFVTSLAWLGHARYAGACDLVTWVPPVGSMLPYLHHGALHCIDGLGAVHQLGSGEEGHAAAEHLRQQCNAGAMTPAEIFRRILASQVPVAQLSDHAPINYVSAVWELR